MDFNQKNYYMIWLLGFFMVCIFLESQDLIKPDQYHEPATQVPSGITFLVPIAIVGTASLASESAKSFNMSPNPVPARLPNLTYLTASGTISPL